MINSIHTQDCQRTLLAVLMIAVVAVAASPVMAADANQGLAGDWLTRYASARSVGMGGATVAVADEPQAALWNPAGVSFLSQNQLQVGSVRPTYEQAIMDLSRQRGGTQ